jgi:hypothetical protein
VVLISDSHGDSNRYTSCSPHEDETGPYTREKSWQPKTDWPGHRLRSPHSPPSRQPWSRGESFRPSDYIDTSVYWTHISVYDRYVQCLLTGANPSVLNRHRRGLQHWRCQLSTYHSLTFPTDSLHFLPMSPARSQVIHPTITN